MMHLQVPADPAYGSVVRGVVAAFATLGDPSIDELDDIRLATQEAFVALMDGVIGADRIDVEIDGTDTSLRLVLRIEGAVTGMGDGGLAMKVLRAISREVSCTEDAGSRAMDIVMATRGAA